MSKSTIGNWFSINRQLLESDLWTSEPFTKSQAWIDLIGLARFVDGFGYKRGIEVPLKRGQLCWSEVNLSKRWKWSRGKVKRFLNELETKQQIVQQNTNVTTITTVVNYERYQPRNTADSTANSTADGQQTGQQTDTKEECKKENNGNNEKKKTISASGDDATESWISASKKILKGKRLEAFKRLWEAFNYKKGRAGAIDSFLSIPSLTDKMMDEIIAQAEATANNRSELIENGGTPIFLQGWITKRRWEDEISEATTKNKMTLKELFSEK